MALLRMRIREAEPLDGFELRLTLTGGSTIEGDESCLLAWPVHEKTRRDSALFAHVRVAGGDVVSPNGSDLCPDVLVLMRAAA